MVRERDGEGGREGMSPLHPQSIFGVQLIVKTSAGTPELVFP